MDMWRLQYSMQCNPQFPSRPSTVKELLKRKKTQSHQESKAAFDDIGAGTMVDFVHSDQTIQQIVDCMFGEKTESGLKHRADMLLCLGFSSRGDSIRKLRLPNIGLISFADEGVCGAKLLRCVWRKPKRNQFGNIEETALMRHREAQRCPFDALALYFFSRWHVGDEPWPDFSDRSTWYPIYVLKGANAVTKSTYPQQYAAMNEVYRILGVQSSVKTQPGRKQASAAENKGASASSVDRQSHWATKSRVGAYAKHSIPFDCDLDQNQADIIYHVLC
uniref:Ndc10 domain-containing protein n=1 Tax=Globisporangium ultimum (strain ATCC 200006 / CBS 805.95 / DAOM BR144) TaxID=431595 RepID=K3WLX8_GLOUD